MELLTTIKELSFCNNNNNDKKRREHIQTHSHSHPYIHSHSIRLAAVSSHNDPAIELSI